MVKRSDDISKTMVTEIKLSDENDIHPFLRGTATPFNPLYANSFTSQNVNMNDVMLTTGSTFGFAGSD